MVRCLALKVLRGGERLYELHVASLAKKAAAFFDIRLSLQLVDRAPQPLDLRLLGLHLAMAGEGLHGVGVISLIQWRSTFS